MTILQIPRIFTPGDLLRTPDSNTMELIDGRLVERQTSVESCEVEGSFLYCFHKFLQQNSIARVFPGSLGYQCFDGRPNTIRKPSVTVVLVDRVERLPQPDPDFMPIAPDLAVEVISPFDFVYDVDGRIREYVDAGFPLVWVADPKAKTVTVYPRGGRPVIYTAEDELTAEAVLPGFRCKVGDFFPTSAPSAKR